MKMNVYAITIKNESGADIYNTIVVAGSAKDAILQVMQSDDVILYGGDTIEISE